MKTVRNIIGIIILLLLNHSLFSQQKVNNERDFIIQLTDPQFGFFAENKNFEKETELYSEAVRQINELKPAFVVITGDFVNNSKNISQIEEFKRITALIDKNIPVFFSPGNHDLGQSPTKEDFRFYFKNYGKGTDCFAFKYKGSAFIGINSVIIKSDKNHKDEKRQFKWLKRQLRKVKNSDNIIIFTHYPFFINDINEKETYSNQSIKVRYKYFDLFKEYGVDVVFAGHLHNSAEASYNGISMITTNSAGRPLGEARPGFRIISFGKDSFSEKYQIVQ